MCVFLDNYIERDVVPTIDKLFMTLNMQRYLQYLAQNQAHEFRQSNPMLISSATFSVPSPTIPS